MDSTFWLGGGVTVCEPVFEQRDTVINDVVLQDHRPGQHALALPFALSSTVSVSNYDLYFLPLLLCISLFFLLHLADILTLLWPTLAFYCPPAANFVQFVIVGVWMSSFGCLCCSHLKI